jgi:hypothetical protein
MRGRFLAQVAQFKAEMEITRRINERISGRRAAA